MTATAPAPPLIAALDQLPARLTRRTVHGRVTVTVTTAAAALALAPPDDHATARAAIGYVVTRTHTRDEGAPLTRRAVVATRAAAAALAAEWLPPAS